MKTIKVNLDKKTASSYEIRIGKGILDRMLLVLAKNFKAAHYVIVTDDNINGPYGQALQDAMTKAGKKVSLLEIPAGESYKNMATVMDLAARLLVRGADRGALLIALGGGVVGDLTGFVASIYMRSIPYIQVPTSLVGQVDSSIGGKTAVDFPQGKNLLGTFYQPRAVFVDVDFLKTLPEKEFQNGLAEVIKYGVIEDEKFFKLLEQEMKAIKSREPELLLKIIETCCRIKKSIVEIDEREQGLRRILNFGHTLGHALETTSKFALSHGEGVALGMIAAAKLSEKMKYLPEGNALRLEQLIEKAGLPTKIDSSLKTGEIISALKSDKKKRNDVVHFVLIKNIGLPFISDNVDERLIGDILEEMKA